MQTFLSKLIDANGNMVNFERWNYKSINTVIKNLKELYKHSIYRKDIAQSKKIVIYKTNYHCNDENKVFEQDINEFLKDV
ncbi:MAG TPA: hypothetical protein GX745_03955 [Clostridiales bacterium]|nr:hypothetical protein [Clostridiales bacterium]